MPTRIISWQQQVLSADPDYFYNKLHPLQYEFSNGRLFYAPPDLYTAYLPVVVNGSPVQINPFQIQETTTIPPQDLEPGAQLVHL